MDGNRALVANFKQSQIRVKAELQGRDRTDDDEFDFTYDPFAGEEGWNTPCPASWDREAKVTNASVDHTEAFPMIGFAFKHKGSTFNYTVKQTVGDIFGIVYDTTPKAVAFTVQERDGGGTIDLIPSPVPLVTFTNRYIQPTVTGPASLTYGETGSLAVSFDDEVPTDDFDLACQWYTCDADGENQKAIDGADLASYALPADLDAGDHYFLCQVTVTGHTATAVYDGKEHGIEGYDAAIDNPLYTENDFTFSGVAEARRADAGTTQMGLSASRFENKNPNFTNVVFDVTDGNQTVTKKPVTVTADAKTKTYGDADPALTYTVSGLVGGDALTGALSRAAGENVGAYDITVGTLSAGSN